MSAPSRLSLAVAAVLSLVGAGLTWSVYRAETAAQQAVFDMTAQRAARRVETRIEQHIALLTAARAFLEVQPEPLGREVFAAFVRALELDGRYSGLQGIGLARILTPEAEAAAEAGLARDYGTEAGVWPEPVPGLRTAITLLEPGDARNRAAMGFDMATEERRRAAMLEALETGEAAATAPLRLVQEITEDVQAGVLIYLPLRRSGDRGPEGFAYAPVRLGDLFTAALEGGDLPIEIRAVDGEAPELPLFETPGYVAEETDRGLSSRTGLDVAGRDWVLLAQPRPSFDEAAPLRHTALSALVFLLLALSASYAVHWQGLAIRRSRALNEAVQRNVEQKDLLLRETTHRLKNALTRVVAIARATAREVSSKEEMAVQLGARLRAMGAAQDLLLLSGTDSADLEELLRSEVDQIAGGPGAVRLSGPQVRLDERQAHALALVFHELATNALKYGAGAEDGGELSVDWSVGQAGSGPELRLAWEERTPVAAQGEPAPGSGFGTRLLEAMVVGELGGTLARQPLAGGFKVEIRIPVAAEA